MTVKTIVKIPEDLTMIATSEFDAPPERVWRVWSDPRQLEKWWGPPGYPATFTDHDFTPGGTAAYYMSWDGNQSHGWWEFTTIEPPSLLVIVDGFADDDGNRNHDMPIHGIKVEISERSGGGTVMVVTSSFESLEAMQKMLEMGVEEGFRQSLSQIDALLAD
jgi:uncharacterized protein YndB with AHSA1/START domain